ncbi:hypothetical protein B0T19DRAFT_118782 [Cercophora scortea]|uniref:Radical SAM core domain-containing protein n=1 Tax=Cercophora scortea TaxID=314031 RepID=A0AAE0IY26_9PEZI|nr:hypothetical protein B0T19DRAFT_118782 [Cercophora scortea]
MTAATRRIAHRLRAGAATHPARTRALGAPFLQTRPIATEALARTQTPSPVHQSPLPSSEGAGPIASPSRKDRLKDALPFSDFLTDTFARQHDYLRISVTERCNLRCVYCMPEEGVPLSPSRSLLTTPEIVLLSSLFVSQGVTKIRLTGGEPTVRRDILPLMQQLGALRPHGLRELCLTTNGLSLHRKLDAMVDAGLTAVNLSLDTLDPWQFQIMTRRPGFAAVMKTVDHIFELNRAGAGIKFKINCVVMRGLNDREILPFVAMTRDKDVEVRFIEYMPFDGNKWNKGKMFSYQEMLDVIRAEHPGLAKVAGHKNDTSKTYQVPGFAGRIGFITSMTHNFCGTCNRLRITGDGNLKVCLFGNAEVSLRDIIRKVNRGEPIDEETFEAMKRTAMAEMEHLSPSDRPIMLAPNSEELLDIIGMAVKRKKEKHAGIGELEHMKNRPMILIDSKNTVHDKGANARLQPQSMPPSQWNHQAGIASIFPSRPTTSHIRRALGSLITMGTENTPFHLRQFSTTTTTVAPKTNTKQPIDNEKKPQENTSSPAVPQQQQQHLTHLSPTGTAHMVSIASKTPTARLATAKCTIRFTNPAVVPLIRENQMKKGDVLGVARVAGIMAAKRTADTIPLCHPIAITHVSVELEVVEEGEGAVEVTATVACDGKTGVEMEALMAASAAALTVYDMCKAVDKGMVVEGLRVVVKEGGRSGRWVEGEQSGS